jgi:hypothetical protein
MVAIGGVRAPMGLNLVKTPRMALQQMGCGLGHQESRVSRCSSRPMSYWNRMAKSAVHGAAESERLGAGVRGPACARSTIFRSSIVRIDRRSVDHDCHRERYVRPEDPVRAAGRCVGYVPFRAEIVVATAGAPRASSRSA